MSPSILPSVLLSRATVSGRLLGPEDDGPLVAARAGEIGREDLQAFAALRRGGGDVVGEGRSDREDRGNEHGYRQEPAGDESPRMGSSEPTESREHEELSEMRQCDLYETYCIIRVEVPHDRS